MEYEQIVLARKRLEAPPGYATLDSVGLGDRWITPPQATSRSRTGLALVGKHFLDAATAERCRDAILTNRGYCPCVPFREVLTEALGYIGQGLEDVYVTQAFHLLPKTDRSASPRAALIDASFAATTAHELRDRTVVALGDTAARACRVAKIPYTYAHHPGYRRAKRPEVARTIGERLREAWARHQARRAGGDP